MAGTVGQPQEQISRLSEFPFLGFDPQSQARPGTRVASVTQRGGVLSSLSAVCPSVLSCLSLLSFVRRAEYHFVSSTPTDQCLERVAIFMTFLLRFRAGCPRAEPHVVACRRAQVGD
jgi:hypothetical protein